MAESKTKAKDNTTKSSKTKHGPKADAPSEAEQPPVCLLYTSPSPRDRTRSRMPSSA